MCEISPPGAPVGRGGPHGEREVRPEEEEEEEGKRKEREEGEERELVHDSHFFVRTCTHTHTHTHTHTYTHTHTHTHTHTEGFIQDSLPGGELDSMYFSTCIVCFAFLWCCC